MRPVDLFTRSNSSVGAEKEISPQHPSHACSWPEPQLSEKMLMQALSVFSERRHALFKPASVWRGGGLPCRITLFTALIHIHRVACPSAAALWTDTSFGQWIASSLQHVMSPPPNAGPPKNWIFSPTPPLLTQHYKVWQSIHSLFSVESDKGEVARGAGFSAEWGRMESDLQQRLKRYMDNISRWWRRCRRSDLRQRALRHPPSFPPFPHPQSLRRPCLRGRRGSSTIANGSAAEWWRGVMKPITMPINLTPRGILSDWMRVKAAPCMRASVHVGFSSIHLRFPGKLEKAFFPGCWLVSSTYQTLT